MGTIKDRNCKDLIEAEEIEKRWQEDTGSIPGSERSPGEGNGNPVHYFLPEKSHGHRSLAGYSPKGHKELDLTEQLI